MPWTFGVDKYMHRSALVTVALRVTVPPLWPSVVGLTVKSLAVTAPATTVIVTGAATMTERSRRGRSRAESR